MYAFTSLIACPEPQAAAQPPRGSRHDIARFILDIGNSICDILNSRFTCELKAKKVDSVHIQGLQSGTGAGQTATKEKERLFASFISTCKVFTKRKLIGVLFCIM